LNSTMTKRFVYTLFALWAGMLIVATIAETYFGGEWMRLVNNMFMAFGLGWTMATVVDLSVNQKEQPKKDTFKIPPHTCTCGWKMKNQKELTAGVNVQRRPAEGDAAICYGCAKLWVFRDDMTMSEPTDKDIEFLQKTGNWGKIEKVREAILRGKTPPHFPNTASL